MFAIERSSSSTGFVGEQHGLVLVGGGTGQRRGSASAEESM